LVKAASELARDEQEVSLTTFRSGRCTLMTIGLANRSRLGFFMLSVGYEEDWASRAGIQKRVENATEWF